MGKPPAFRALRSRATETHQILRDEILAALESIIFDSYHNSFTIRVDLEKAFAAEVQQNHAVAVHSGTVGLFLALRACGIGAGDEVITVGNSDISTTGAISQCGGVPVLCDVLLSDYTVNPDLVENLITDKTRALLPVDMHGHPANVKLLRPIADHYGLKIVEDAALASGAFDYGLPVGAFADITMFSFSAFKPLGSSGNGAMLVTNSDELCEKLRLLAGYGHDPIREGCNGWLPELRRRRVQCPARWLGSGRPFSQAPLFEGMDKKAPSDCLSARSGLGTYIGENARVSRRVGADIPFLCDLRRPTN